MNKILLMKQIAGLVECLGTPYTGSQTALNNHNNRSILREITITAFPRKRQIIVTFRPGFTTSKFIQGQPTYISATLVGPFGDEKLELPGEDVISHLEEKYGFPLHENAPYRYPNNCILTHSIEALIENFGERCYIRGEEDISGRLIGIKVCDGHIGAMVIFDEGDAFINSVYFAVPGYSEKSRCYTVDHRNIEIGVRPSGK